MSENHFISVIVPAWNAEAVLAGTLASAQNQVYSRYEVIVVDDGSTDRTGDIARRFAETDPKFKVLRQDNAGSAAARNTGLEQARGDWIAFLDADDVWLPTKLARQVELLESDPKANLIFSNCWFWDGRQDLGVRHSKDRDFPEGDVSRELIYWDLFCTSTVMVKRESVERAGRFDPELRNSQDWDLWLRIAEAGLWARGVREPQVRYRFWSGNVSSNKVRNNGYFVRMFEKAVARPQTPERLRHYRRSLRMARANLELAKAQSMIDQSPDAVPAAVLRAWRCYPPHLKWLFRYLALAWPGALGGRWTSNAVLRKLRKWRRGLRPDAQQ